MITVQVEIAGASVTHLAGWVGPTRYRLWCASDYHDVDNGRVVTGSGRELTAEIRDVDAVPRRRHCGLCLARLKRIGRWAGLQ